MHKVIGLYIKWHLFIALAMAVTSLNAGEQKGSGKVSFLMHPFMENKGALMKQTMPLIEIFEDAGFPVLVSVADSYGDEVVKGLRYQPTLILTAPHMAKFFIEKYNYEVLFYGKNKVSYSVYTHKDFANDDLKESLRGKVVITNDKYALSTAIMGLRFKQDFNYLFNIDYFHYGLKGYDRVIDMLINKDYRYGVLLDRVVEILDNENMDQLAKVYSLDDSYDGILLIHKDSEFYKKNNRWLKSQCHNNGFYEYFYRLKQIVKIDVVCHSVEPFPAQELRRYDQVFRMLRQ